MESDAEEGAIEFEEATVSDLNAATERALKLAELVGQDDCTEGGGELQIA